MSRHFIASISSFALMSSSAYAGDIPAFDLIAGPAEPGIDLVIELGVAGQMVPAYEGADEYDVSPSPIIDFDYLHLPGLFDIGSLAPDDGGWSISPGFNYTGERKVDDYDALEGLDDVDATFEVGIGAGYEWTHAEVWGEGRYAFGGAEGFVGEFGANAILRPNAKIELKAGPFATLASADYMGSYFGVTPEEAASTGFRLEAYDPDAGFKSVGVTGTARYEFRPDWFLNAEASYSRLIGNAGDSPIAEAGSQDQFTFGLGLSRRFSLDLF